MWNLLVYAFAIGLCIPSWGLSLLMLFFLSSDSDNRAVANAGAGWGCVMMIPTALLAFMLICIAFLALTGVPMH
jgi:hypothetical protein